jgi:tetratricopeptide (TPR) repeat protein
MTIAECYRLLQLSPQASLAEVKASYRRLARQYHPDVNSSDRHAQEKFIQVTEAYKQLVKVVPARVVPRATSSPTPARQPATPGKPVTPQQSSRAQAPNPSPQSPKQRETASPAHKSYSRQNQQTDSAKRPPPAESPPTKVRVRPPQPPVTHEKGVRNPAASSSTQSSTTSHPQQTTPPNSAPPISTPSTPTPSISTPFDLKLKQASYTQLQELLKYRYFARAVALIEGLAQRLPYDAEVRQWQAITYQCWGRYLVSQRQLHKARYYFKKALHTDPHNKSLSAEVEQDVRRLEKIR